MIGLVELARWQRLTPHSRLRGVIVHTDEAETTLAVPAAYKPASPCFRVLCLGGNQISVIFVFFKSSAVAAYVANVSDPASALTFEHEPVVEDVLVDHLH